MTDKETKQMDQIRAKTRDFLIRLALYLTTHGKDYALTINNSPHPFDFGNADTWLDEQSDSIARRLMDLRGPVETIDGDGPDDLDEYDDWIEGQKQLSELIPFVTDFALDPHEGDVCFVKFVDFIKSVRPLLQEL